MKAVITLLIFLFPFFGFGQEYFEAEDNNGFSPISIEITNDERIVIFHTGPSLGGDPQDIYYVSKFHLFGDNIFSNFIGGITYLGNSISGLHENSNGEFVFLNNMSGTDFINDQKIIYKYFNLKRWDSAVEESEIITPNFIGVGDIYSHGFFQSEENIYNILYSGEIQGSNSNYNLVKFNQSNDEVEYLTLPFVSDKFSLYENGNLILMNDEKILKVDNNFNTIFLYDIPIDEVDDYNIISTSDGGALIYGNEYSNLTLSEDFKLYKINVDGTLDWEYEFGGYNNDFPYSAIETYNNGYIVVGSKQSDMSSENSSGGMWILELDSEGDIISSFIFGNDGDYAKDIKLHPNGNYYILGKKDDNTIVLTYESQTPNNITNYQNFKKLIKKTNLLGQEIKSETSQLIIEIFDDGSVEKKVIIQ